MTKTRSLCPQPLTHAQIFAVIPVDLAILEKYAECTLVAEVGDAKAVSIVLVDSTQDEIAVEVGIVSFTDDGNPGESDLT